MFADNKKTAHHGPGNVTGISITGGNFVKSAVGSSERVVFNNANTTVQVISKSGI